MATIRSSRLSAKHRPVIRKTTTRPAHVLMASLPPARLMERILWSPAHKASPALQFPRLLVNPVLTSVVMFQALQQESLQLAANPSLQSPATLPIAPLLMPHKQQKHLVRTWRLFKPSRRPQVQQCQALRLPETRTHRLPGRKVRCFSFHHKKARTSYQRLRHRPCQCRVRPIAPNFSMRQLVRKSLLLRRQQ